MTQSECPRCGMRVADRGGVAPVRCPRCLAHGGTRIELVRSLLKTKTGLRDRTPPSRG